MESNNHEAWMSTIVESFLPRFSNREVTLVFKIESSMHIYLDEKQYDEREYFLVLFHRPSNYTKVLVKKYGTDDDNRMPFSFENSTIIMEKMSDHDSCWRSDGLRWIFKSWMGLRKKCEELGVDPQKIRENENWVFHPYFLGESILYYLVDIKPEDPRDDRNWNYVVHFKGKVLPKDVGEYLSKEKN